MLSSEKSWSESYLLLFDLINAMYKRVLLSSLRKTLLEAEIFTVYILEIIGRLTDLSAKEELVKKLMTKESLRQGDAVFTFFYEVILRTISMQWIPIQVQTRLERRIDQNARLNS